MNEETLFHEARQKPVGERTVFLDQVCGGDLTLRRRIEILLQADDNPDSLLKLQPPATSAILSLSEVPGQMIGPYKLLEQIGEGGMGVVFMAEQQEPVRRKVALKVIKPGMDTRQVIARFEAERQALAVMDHPSIARVLDAGATDSGRPYFVMELVRGVPITTFCDENNLPVRERLELFASLCQAIQHAHTKGIVHRDIKPSNVLVTRQDGRAVVKVIDFGVAKAMGQQLTEKTLFTNFAQMIGTPLYMSPEQAEQSGVDIDTRSDIYSLGVLLYELLTGSTPVDAEQMKQAAFDEVRRIIREDEPQTPSARISGSHTLPAIAAYRHIEPARLSKLVRGDLDWIVMKALEKDRGRRYETANGFAADVLRYLNDEPVQAYPPSAGYQFRKFARRNKGALVTGSLVTVAVLLVVAVLAGSIGWVSRDRAARRLVVEQAVGRALEEGDDLQKQGKWQEALVAVERAEAALASGEGGAELQQQVNDQLADLHMIQRLEQLRLQRGGHWDNKSANRAYARAFADFGMDVENLSPPDVAARIRRRPSTAIRMAAALDDWTMVLRDWGLRDRTRDPATWKRLLEAARLADPDPWRSQLRQSMGQEDLNALRKLAEASDITALPPQSLQLMGNALIFGGDGPACVAWLRKAHRQHPGDALITFDLTFHLSNLPSAEWVEVLRFAEAGLAAQQSPGMYCYVGHALSQLGRYDEAVAVLRKAVELQPDFADAHANLGFALSQQVRLGEAITACRKAIELDPNLAASHNNLAWLLTTGSDVKFRDPKRAVELAKKAVELEPKNAIYWQTLGVAQYRVDDWRGAIVALEKVTELGSPGDSMEWFPLAMAHWQLDEKDVARQWYDRAVEWMAKNNPQDQELRRFRAEATDLLKIEDKSRSQQDGISNRP